MQPAQTKSAVQRLGGEERLRVIIDDFVDRIVRDMMIGFFFRSVDIPRLKQLEFEFAAAHLGSKTRYTGRPMTTAHAAHAILSGHFNRRLKILENTLRDFDVPDEVVHEWLEHNTRLRPAIVRSSSECISAGDYRTNRAEEHKP